MKLWISLEVCCLLFLCFYRALLSNTGDAIDRFFEKAINWSSIYVRLLISHIYRILWRPGNSAQVMYQALPTHLHSIVALRRPSIYHCWLRRWHRRKPQIALFDFLPSLLALCNSPVCRPVSGLSWWCARHGLDTATSEWISTWTYTRRLKSRFRTYSDLMTARCSIHCNIEVSVSSFKASTPR